MIGSGGQVFTLNDVSWYTGGNASDHVDCVNGALSNCIFTVSYPDMAKGLWICGDSYITINDSTRWAYYLGEFGQLDNVMLHGYPGQGSITAIPSLEKELLLSVPKALVYCYGMNDGSDSDSVAANNWQYGFENIKALSNKYGFELILATIPTVPSINNEVKNSTIRNSKYRFIDFAKAVGASSSGVWYTGMLATDNVHPRIPGGFALYNAAIQAVPEIASDK